MYVTQGKKLRLSTEEVIGMATRRCINDKGETSAKFCLHEAVKLLHDGDSDSARRWAIRSLQHSVGIFHADYTNATIATEN